MTDRRAWFAGTLLCVIAGLGSPSGAQTLPGNPIHEFSLLDLNSLRHEPGDYRGQILILFLLGHN